MTAGAQQLEFETTLAPRIRKLPSAHLEEQPSLASVEGAFCKDLCDALGILVDLCSALGVAAQRPDGVGVAWIRPFQAEIRRALESALDSGAAPVATAEGDDEMPAADEGASQDEGPLVNEPLVNDLYGCLKVRWVGGGGRLGGRLQFWG